MTPPSKSVPFSSNSSDHVPSAGVLLAALFVVLAGLAAYSNSFSGQFVYDDPPSITDNPTIQHGIWEAFHPPDYGPTVTGRPLVNVTLAINYALGGFDVAGYHAMNIAIHLLAGLALLGLVRRTLDRPVLRATFGEHAVMLAFATALLWVLHPLQTQAATYINQRAESLVGLFYLLTLYCFARSLDGTHPRVWEALSLGASLLGMASKEVMITAPVMVLLYDRTFGAGTFGAALRRRWRYYAALAATWSLLLALILGAHLRAGTVGFHAGMSWRAYALKQCEAVPHYLWLSFWPHPLVLDYGADVITHPSAVWPQIILLGALLAGTVYALWRRPELGFLGAWFFVILSPSSSIVPLTKETMTERRVYLSLAAVAVALVLVLYQLLGRRVLPAVLALALAFGLLTLARNYDYALATRILAQNVAEMPDNFRVQQNLASELARSGRLLESVQEYEAVLRRSENDPYAHSNLGNALALLGKNDAAIMHYRRALELQPDLIDTRNALGNLLSQTGQPAAAAVEFQTILRYRPDSMGARIDLANAYNFSGRPADGRVLYEEVLQREPDSADAHYGLGNSLFLLQETDAAAKEYATAAHLKPDFAPAYASLGNTLLLLKRPAEAEAAYRTALRLDPQSETARTGLRVAGQAQISSAPASAAK